MTGIAIPETAEELEELLNDNDRIGEILAGGQLADFSRQYMAKALAKKGAELGAQMREQMQLGMQQFLQQAGAAGGGSIVNGFRPGSAAGVTGRDVRMNRAIARSRLADPVRQAEKQGLFNPLALGASADDSPYAESIGRFLRATYKGEQAAKDRGDNEEVVRIQGFKQRLANALSERIPAEGGFLVPEVLRSEILMISLEESVIRPRARLIPMDSLRVPLPAIDDVSHASSVYGGVTAYWTEEGAGLTPSAPSFARIVLEAKKLTAYTTIPNELLQDAVTPLDTWFNLFFPRAIAWFEDVAFITGSGVGEPQGLINAPGAVTVAAAEDNQVQFQDVAAVFPRMWPASLGRAVWLCSPDVLNQLLTLAAASTNNSTTTIVAPPGWLTAYQALDYPGGGNGDGVNYRLMGRPLIVSEKLPSSTSSNTTQSGALMFVDLDYYLLGDRQTMQVASSEEYLFANDLVAYRVIERLDGRFWLQSAITPENGGPTLSPLVLLNTRS
jgi:HK97 family phage major capsid protein